MNINRRSLFTSILTAPFVWLFGKVATAASTTRRMADSVWNDLTSFKLVDPPPGCWGKCRLDKHRGGEVVLFTNGMCEIYSCHTCSDKGNHLVCLGDIIEHDPRKTWNDTYHAKFHIWSETPIHVVREYKYASDKLTKVGGRHDFC